MNSSPNRDGDAPARAVYDTDDDTSGRVPRPVWSILGVILLLVVGVAVLWIAAAVWLTIFAGILGGIGLNALANWTSNKTQMPRLPSLALIIVLLTATCAGLSLWIGPALYGQLEDIGTRLSEFGTAVMNWLRGTTWGPTLIEAADVDALTSSGTRIFGTLGGWLVSVIGGFGAFLIIIAFSIYLAISPQTYLSAVSYLIPPPHRNRFGEVADEVRRGLEKWLLGRFASMTVVGVGTAVGLWVAGVPSPLALGIVAGALSFIPNIGPVLAATPGLLVAWTVSGTAIAWALAVYVGVQMLENYLITPLIQQRAVKMPPAVLLAAQILIAMLGGFIGLFLATPLTVAIIIIVQMVYVRDRLGDSISTLAEN